MSSHDDQTHRRLRQIKGRAADYDCVECSKPAYEWAYQHSGQPDDLDSYAPMCRSCHRKLDHKKSPVLQEAWKKARAELTVEIQRAGGRNAPHPGKKFTHEEAVEMGRKGGLAKAENRKNKKG